MKDITILFLTASRVPKGWAAYHRSILEMAIGDAPLISISREPLNFGINIVQVEPESSSNVWWQILKGAKIADTSYIGIAEDDTLYEAEHFRFRPPEDCVAYNRSRLGITLGQKKPCFYWRNRITNAAMIGPRKLIIEALEERYAKYPNGTPDKYTGEIGREQIERGLRVTRRNRIDFYTTIPIIQFKHNYRRAEMRDVRRVTIGAMRSYDIYHWGKAEDLVKKFQ